MSTAQHLDQYISTDALYGEHYESSPQVKMLSALLLRTLKDMVGLSINDSKNNWQRHIDDAWRWARSDDCKACCKIVGVEYEKFIFSGEEFKKRFEGNRKLNTIGRIAGITHSGGSASI